MAWDQQNKELHPLKFSPALRHKRQIVTKNSVVDTPDRGLLNVPAGSLVEPPNSPDPGIITKGSVVDTPDLGLVRIPDGSKVVPNR